MCGICGIYNSQPNTPINVEQLQIMNATLRHRGPDDSGVWVAEGGQVGLANSRLAIIDLSAAGHQPMCNEDGSVWVAYNGETYNFAQLRAELQQAGHQFRSHTDTETLVHLYEDVGDDLVHRLRGMFAFALWDARQERLLLARDRLGIKPLYYAIADGRLVFGSEIKALFASGLVQPTLNREAMMQYLALGYVAAPDTLFADIHKLAPGHTLTVDRSGIKIHRYWDIYQDTASVEGRSEAEYIDLIRDKLEESVKLRLVADVPVGVFLSGGIDSSLIAALASRQSGQAVKTFTLGFRGHPEYNELGYARRVADHLGAEAHEVLIGPEEVKEFFPSFLNYQEEPVSNAIWFATYFVSKLARDNGVIVVLSGDGGDELFAGYNKWMEYLKIYDRGWKSLRTLPRAVRKAGGAAALALLRNPGQRELVRRGVAGEELFWSGTVFKHDELGRMLAPDLAPRNGDLWRRLPISRWRSDFTSARAESSDGYLDWMAYSALKGGLLEDYLMRLDKMGMAASIEGRVPFLDHEFLALSMSIPPNMKYPGYRNKHLLKQVALQVLPEDVVNRRKMGFCAPVEAWLADAFGPQLAEGLMMMQSRERLFNPVWLEESLVRLKTGLGLTSKDWALLALGQWYSQWIVN